MQSRRATRNKRSTSPTAGTRTDGRPTTRIEIAERRRAIADAYDAAVAALVAASSYRPHVEFEADKLVDAALPHLRRMIMLEDTREDENE